jgi:nicotinate-nucleotide adenylyltransferase
VSNVTINHTKTKVSQAQMLPKKQIGLMGGTFNPPHLGHLMIAEQVKSQLGLDKVLFMPDNVPPHVDAKETISAQTRLEMVRLSIADNPGFGIEDIELNRGGVSYSYDTLVQLKELHPENDYYFIIGGDMVEYLPKWYRIDELVKLVNFVGVTRNGYAKTSPYPILWVDAPIFDISSTQIRKKVALGCSIKYLVTPTVEKYIREEGLYHERT